MEKARCLIFDSELNKSFWGEAVRTAVFLTNRTQTSALSHDLTPAEVWYSEKPDLKKIKLFGSIAHNLIPKEDRSSKLDSHSKKLIMVGYTDNGYRLWDDEHKKIVLGRNIVFDEVNRNQKLITEDYDDEDFEESPINEKNKIDNKIQETIDNAEEIGEATNLRSTRIKTLPKRFEDFQVDLNGEFESDLIAALSAGCLIIDLPSSYSDAISDQGWKAAIQEELDSLEKNQTWELVKPPENSEIIDSKWVFREKIVNGEVIKKARLVARGYQQKSLNDVYAPVARMVTVRVLLSLSLEYDLFGIFTQ